jgi:hypothetical protein
MGEELLVTGGPDAIRGISAALNRGLLPNTFVAEGRPVHAERVSGTVAQSVDDDSPLPIRASVITGPMLANLLAHHTRLVMELPSGASREWTPPSGVLSAILARKEWDLDPLAGIIGMPIIRRDGTLLQQPGYDRQTGLFLAPKVALGPIDESPNAAEVEDARNFIFRDLLGDFEWKADADQANFVALLVTPFLRRFLRCLTPLGIISASMPGSGKSTLAGIIGQLAGQKTLPWAEDDAELRKAITSAFTVEAGVVTFDNLDEGTVINSAILANLLTNPVWSDRILGSTRVGSWANERLWLVTGNNLRVGGDIASRCVYVRLAPKNAHPEERTGFKIPNLDDWILRAPNQAKVIRALLTLILDWTRNGARRDTKLSSMRQFTEWAHGVGGFLAHHRVGGFLGNLDALREADEDDMRWSAFLAMWHKRHGSAFKKAAEIFADGAVDEIYGQAPIDRWEGAFITSPRGARPRSAVQLGQWLTGHDDRPHSDLRLQGVRDPHTKNQVWRVLVVGETQK